MSDIRRDRSDEFKRPFPERGNPHGGRGRRAERDVAEQFETQTGHPLGRAPAGTAPDARSGAAARRGTAAGRGERGQHARTGQAESPRELNLNQPEKRRTRHR